MSGFKQKSSPTIIPKSLLKALKKFKRMVKESELMVELRTRSYYEKPSMVKREKKNLQKSRHKYNQMKENYRDY